MERIRYQQLLPDLTELSIHRLLESVPWDDAPPERPYTVASFVASADGRITVGGHSAPLSDDGDRELHRSLRERVDGVLAGTGTVAAENYGRMLPAPERRERRLAAGRTAEPLAVIVTRTGEIPLGVRLFAEAEARAVLFAPRPPAREPAAQLSYERLNSDDPRPLSAVLATLRQRYGVRTLLCEGGPRLFDAMLRERLVDELFLTVAPTLAGGDGPAVASGPPPAQPLDLRLAALLRREGSVFLRYLVS